MCGRYTVSKPKLIASVFQVTAPVGTLFEPRWNAAPTQIMPVVRADHGGGREVVPMRWGLVPGWATDLAIGNRMINARGETLAEKPAFKRLVSKRRCLVPATGFYEWQKVGKGKRPHLLTVAGAEMFGMAGLWDTWMGPDGEVTSYTIVTTTPNAVAALVHDRMPAIIKPEEYSAWLDPATPRDKVMAMIGPYSGEMSAVPVSTRVNSPGNDVPECATPAQQGIG